MRTDRHIALVIQHYPPYLGGAERQASLYADALARRGTTTVVLTTRFRRELASRATEGGTSIRRLPTAGPRFLKMPVNLVVGFAAGLRLAGCVDVFHGHCLSPFVLGALMAAKLRGRPCLVKVCSVGGEGDVEKIRSNTVGALLWRAFRSADRFVAPTTLVADELIAQGAAPHQVSLVPNLLTAVAAGKESRDARLGMRRALGLGDRPTLLYVGRLSPEKGLDRIMQLWPEMARRADLRLVLVGDGPQRPEIERWRVVHELQQSVILAGYQADPDPYYQAADIFVFPSRSETFGNAIVEAMRHGLPVATTPVGVVTEWPDDAPILRLDQTDCAAWIPVLTRLIETENLRADLGARAASFVTGRYGESEICDQYEHLYQELIDTRRRRLSRR